MRKLAVTSPIVAGAIMLSTAVPVPLGAQLGSTAKKQSLAEETMKAASELYKESPVRKQLEVFESGSKQALDAFLLNEERRLSLVLGKVSSWSALAEEVGFVTRELEEYSPKRFAESDEEARKLAKDALIRANEAAKKLNEEVRRQCRGRVRFSAARLAEFRDSQPNKFELLARVKLLEELHNSYQRTLYVLPELAVFDYRDDKAAVFKNEEECSDVRIEMIRTVLDVLDADEDDIRARWGIENARAIALLEQENLRQIVEKGPPGLNKTLQEARTNQSLDDVMKYLQAATAFVARGNRPNRLAELRLRQQEGAHSLRRSAVVARYHERTLLAGTRRIVDHYKGRMTSANALSLLEAIATTAIAPVIAIK